MLADLSRVIPVTGCPAQSAPVVAQCRSVRHAPGRSAAGNVMTNCRVGFRYARPDACRVPHGECLAVNGSKRIAEIIRNR